MSGIAGCAALPPDIGYREADALVQSRLGVAPYFQDRTIPTADGSAAIPPQIDRAAAVRIAFRQSPRVMESFSRIGLSRADLEAARRFANPELGFSRLDAAGAGDQVSRSLTLSLNSLVLQPVRTRYARSVLGQKQMQVAHEMQDLATAVEVAWFDASAARQIADTRVLIAKAARQSATLAQRFFEAGNISRLQLAQEQAAAATAEVESTHAGLIALQARTALATLMGLPVGAAWITSELPGLPVAPVLDPDDLVELAISQRLDLGAARARLSMAEDALVMARRWRWLGRFEVGVEREHDVDGSVLEGPSFVIELPLFNQGQDNIARAEARVALARSRLDDLTLRVHNSVHAGIGAMAMARTIAEQYRTDLLPAREAVVAGTQEEVNFMLKGVFELLLAKQAEFDAWQGYLESVRDFWIQHARLGAAVGGRLPEESVSGSRHAPIVLPEHGAGSTPDHHHKHGDAE